MDTVHDRGIIVHLESKHAEPLEQLCDHHDTGQSQATESGAGLSSTSASGR